MTSCAVLLMWLPAVALITMWVTSWHILWLYRGAAVNPPSATQASSSLWPPALRIMVFSGHIHIVELNLFERTLNRAATTGVPVGPRAYPMAVSYAWLKDNPSGITAMRYRATMTRSDWFDITAYAGSYRFPLWIAATAWMIPTAWWTFWLRKRRRRRRVRDNLCMSCGYPLPGVDATTRCPECGSRRGARGTDQTAAA